MPVSNTSALARRSWFAAAALALVGIASFSKATQPEAIPTGHTEKLLGTPRFYQCDPRGQFPDQGRNYCCLTAVSDSLMYLASHGFPRLDPNGISDPTQAQITLIDILALYCMNTDPATGTDAERACAGVEQYVQASGYVCQTLEYRGWRRFSRDWACYQTRSMPTLDWIKQGATDPHGAAWVNVGWYVHGETRDEWKRVGGHWLAVVGCGVDGSGRQDASVLLVDNPAAWPEEMDSTDNRPARRRLPDGTELPTDAEIGGDVIKTALIGQGRLVGNYRGLPRDAAGMYSVCGRGLSMPAKYDAAFIDGAMVLVIRDR